jgi:hypothetical protein
VSLPPWLSTSSPTTRRRRAALARVRVGAATGRRARRSRGARGPAARPSRPRTRSNMDERMRMRPPAVVTGPAALRRMRRAAPRRDKAPDAALGRLARRTGAPRACPMTGQLRLFEPPRALFNPHCVDCDTNTNAIDEYYMVHDVVWPLDGKECCASAVSRRASAGGSSRRTSPARRSSRRL